MPNLTSVTLTAGVPTAGTGTVSTLDNVIGTAGTGSAQVLTIQGAASGTAVPVALAAETTKVIGVVHVGDGTSSAAVKAASTSPLATDPALVVTISPNSIVSSFLQYKTVAASATDQILGATGGVGDYIEGVLCIVATAATSQVQIKDGNGSAIIILANGVGAGVGTYYIPLGLITVNATTPGWKITTAAGVSVIGTGKFT